MSYLIGLGWMLRIAEASCVRWFLCWEYLLLNSSDRLGNIQGARLNNVRKT